MTLTHPSVTLVDAWFDSPMWSAVKAELGKVLGDALVSVESWAPRPLPTLDPTINGLDVVECLSAQPSKASPRLGVGIEMGAGAVAALINQGKLDAGILIDPNIVPLVHADGSLTRLMPQEDPVVLEQMGPRLEEIEDLITGDPSTDPMPTPVIEVFTGAFTGEPARVRMAELQRREYDRRAPFLRDLNVTGDATERLNWVNAWSTTSNDIEIWLSTPSTALGEYLAQLPQPHGLVSLTDWPRFPLLSAPDAVAERIAVWVRKQIAEHEGTEG
ncbi:hypothetical protein [Microlunatus sp. GCM10028923]|uniref:hypothetical protein n=1 Tax=Microlunatus sp. GCM10028923 TaxID=3273400 RepID=UPI003607C0E9